MTTDLQKSLSVIEKAKANGFECAFLPEPYYDTINKLRLAGYNITQGWNNKYLTGYSLMAFGYIVKLK